MSDRGCLRCGEPGFDRVFNAIRSIPVNLYQPVDEINLFAVILSNSTEDVVLEVVSGNGESSETTFYVPDGYVVWVRSMGLEAEFSDTPDISWNVGKYLRVQRRYYGRRKKKVEYEVKIGAESNDDCWRRLKALSECVTTTKGFPKPKEYARFDLVANENWSYWFINQKGDEYIRLVADAGIFTYSDDVPSLFLKAYLYDVSEFEII